MGCGAVLTAFLLKVRTEFNVIMHWDIFLMQELWFQTTWRHQ